jgi:hypothetical protein
VLKGLVDEGTLHVSDDGQYYVAPDGDALNDAGRPEPRLNRLIGYRMLGSAALALGSVALPGIALARRRWLRGLKERLGAGPATGWSADLDSCGVGRGSSRRVTAGAGTSGPRASSRVVDDDDLGSRPGSSRDAGGRQASWHRSITGCRSAGRSNESGRDRWVLVETELWPEMLTSSLSANIPVALVNGRISDRTYRRYARMRRWLSPLLGRLAAVLARSEVDRERLIALGCRSEVCVEPGELKSASMVMPSARGIRSAPPFVLVAGSLHGTELCRGWGCWDGRAICRWPTCWRRDISSDSDEIDGRARCGGNRI